MTLSPRELEVLTLVGRDGQSYKAISNSLGISMSTVRSYVARILTRYPSEKRPRSALTEIYYTVVTSDDVKSAVVKSAD